MMFVLSLFTSIFISWRHVLRQSNWLCKPVGVVNNKARSWPLALTVFHACLLLSHDLPAAGSTVLLVCAVGAEAIGRSVGSGRHCAKPGCRTCGSDSVVRSPVCQQSAVFRFDSRLSSPGSGKGRRCLSDGRSGRRSPWCRHVWVCLAGSCRSVSPSFHL